MVMYLSKYKSISRPYYNNTCTRHMKVHLHIFFLNCFNSMSNDIYFFALHFHVGHWLSQGLTVCFSSHDKLKECRPHHRIVFLVFESFISASISLSFFLAMYSVSAFLVLSKEIWNRLLACLHESMINEVNGNSCTLHFLCLTPS